MVKKFIMDNNECISKLIDLPSSDQQYQVHEMIDLPLDSLEYSILNQSNVIVEGSTDKDEIRERKPKFVITRGCPIRYFDRMDLEHEVSDIEEEIAPVHAP